VWDLKTKKKKKKGMKRHKFGVSIV